MRCWALSKRGFDTGKLRETDMRVILASLLVFILVACGGGGDSDSGAGEAAVDQFEAAIRGQWGRAWDDLIPEHQAIVSRDQYIACQEDQGDFPASDISVDETFEETVDVAVLGETETTAVTLKFESGDRSQFTTVHMIEVDGDWKWSLQADALEAFEAGECP